MFTRPYNACDYSKQLLNGKTVTVTPLWEAERDDDGVILRHNPITNKNYIAEVRLSQQTILIGIRPGVSTSFTGLVSVLDFSFMGYDKIINVNYTQFERMLKWNNVRQLEMRLTAQDMFDFDFFKLIFIKELGSYFYANKVVYKGKPTSIIEAVKVQKKAQVFDLNSSAS